jgi:2-keto-4-pentenoate hydratase
MSAASLEQLAAWLAEALETGAAVGPLPAEAEPAGITEGERVAALVLESLDLAPCGLRLAYAPGGERIAGPVLEGRLLPDGAAVALATVRHATVRHATVTPGVMGVLADDLAPEPEGGSALPAFSALHPILDVSSWRLREPPGSAGLAAADLAGHGFIIAGRGKKKGPSLESLPVSMAPASARRRREPRNAAAALLAAAEAARRGGGLPRGALLVAVLGQGIAPRAGEELVAGLGVLGRVHALFR